MNEAVNPQPKYKYIGQCDKLRMKNDTNEQYWQLMMKNKKKISIKKFLFMANLSSLLDDDETPEEWITDGFRSDPTAGTYISKWGNKQCVFVQIAGFEFIFIK